MDGVLWIHPKLGLFIVLVWRLSTWRGPRSSKHHYLGLESLYRRPIFRPRISCKNNKLEDEIKLRCFNFFPIFLAFLDNIRAKIYYKNLKSFCIKWYRGRKLLLEIIDNSYEPPKKGVMGHLIFFLLCLNYYLLFSHFSRLLNTLFFFSWDTWIVDYYLSSLLILIIYYCV